MGLWGSATCKVRGDGQSNTAHEGTWPWSSVPAGDWHHPSGCAGAGHQRRGGQGHLLAKGVCIRSLRFCCPLLRIYCVCYCSAEQDSSMDTKSSPVSPLPRPRVFSLGKLTTEVVTGPPPCYLAWTERIIPDMGTL